MNNKQKAKELAELHQEYYDEGGAHCSSSSEECYDSALGMAEWKDAQFIKFLEDHIGDEILVKTIDEFKKLINDK